MIFKETSRFTELVKTHLSDDEYAAFQWLLFERPDAGSIVSGSGGVRKIRWGLRGEIWLLTMYPKNERETIPGHILKQYRVGDR